MRTISPISFARHKFQLPKPKIRRFLENTHFGNTYDTSIASLADPGGGQSGHAPYRGLKGGGLAPPWMAEKDTN